MHLDRWNPSTSSRAPSLIAAVMVAVVACGAPIDPPASDPIAASAAPMESIASTTADPNPSATTTPSTIEPPALTWRRHDLPDGPLLSVTVVDGRFLAVGSIGGQGDSVGESDDGLVWRALANRPFGHDRPWSITSSEDRLIVLARRPVGEGSQTAVWRSPDGTDWEPWIEPEGFRHPRSLARFHDQWLMQSVFDAGISLSDDGKVWTRVVAVEASEAAGFALGPAGVVAGYTLDNPSSFQAAVFHTADGVDWRSTLLDEGGIAMVDCMGANTSTYVALGQARRDGSPFTGAAWLSIDGTSWQRATVPNSFESAEWSTRQIARYGGSYIALVQLGEGQVGLLSSSDGRAWLFLEPMPQQSLNEAGLVVIDDRVVVYGTDPDDAATGVVWEGSVTR